MKNYFDLRDIHHLFTDMLIIGSGVAGLRAALAADRNINVLVITKDKASVSNTQQAQGGIAISLGGPGSVSSHVKDTLEVGCGLCDVDVVEEVCSRGEQEFKQLLDWGAQFDRQGGQWLLGLEGGHSERRVIHSEGVQTGKEVVRVLLGEVERRSNIKILEDHFLVNLLLDDERAAGALVMGDQKLLAIHAGQVVMASGGIGQIYRETTNPSVATGDGLGAALRCGVRLSDMEFVQFHPTTLYIAGAARMLISEAVRGAGGRLIDCHGVPFMHDVHVQGDLAPRDVVSRAILKRIKKTHDTKVYLDVRHLKEFDQEFSSLYKVCLNFGIDPFEEPIPVHPAAHYHIGGIHVDLDGRSSVDGLFAIGEVARNGLHGANRLASNSLLEGLVLGHRTGALASVRFSDVSRCALKMPSFGRKSFDLDLDDMRRSLRHLMWRQVGIIRNGEGLQKALDQLNQWMDVLNDRIPQSTSDWELINMMTVSRRIIQGALKRKKSCGVHYRSDDKNEVVR